MLNNTSGHILRRVINVVNVIPLKYTATNNYQSMEHIFIWNHLKIIIK